MARLIELKQTAPERFLARFDTGEEMRTTLAVVTDFHLRSGKELTSQELDALRAASERSRCRQRALRIIGARAMSVKELSDRLKEKRVHVVVTDAAVERIIEQSFDPAYGARPINRFIQSHIETLIARKLIAEDVAPDSTITVEAIHI